jgi:CheY-like chemotaxis protein
MFCLRADGCYAGCMTGSRSILIVEDEPLIAMMLEDFVISLGHEVSGNCDSVEAAMKEVENGTFDLAILDVNLKGENVWPVAAALRSKGTPFVLASGGHVDPPPPEFRNVPMIEKPYTIDRVTPIIDAVLAASDG